MLVFFKSHAKVGRDVLDAVLGVERIVVADEVGVRLALAGFWRVEVEKVTVFDKPVR